MSMTKKDFVALADAIRYHNQDESLNSNPEPFTADHINILSRFCQSQNSNFMRDRWLDYIAGTCGKSGGKAS